MPNPQEAADPFDVLDKGIPFDTNSLSSGEPKGQQSDIAKLLGVEDPDEDDEDTTDEDDDEEQDRSEGTGAKAAKAKEKKDAAENYAAKIQVQSEELYAINLKRAREEEGYLDKLISSNDPLDQRMAKKLLERNDFGSKTVADYKKSLLKKAVGDDPVKQELAEIKSSLQELRSEKKTEAWSNWKKENSVRGEAAKLADEIRARYPDMEPPEVLDMVRGKLGVSNLSSMKEEAFAGSRSAMPETNETDLNSPVARKMLKGIDVKALKKFSRKMARG